MARRSTLVVSLPFGASVSALEFLARRAEGDRPDRLTLRSAGDELNNSEGLVDLVEIGFRADADHDSADLNFSPAAMVVK